MHKKIMKHIRQLITHCAELEEWSKPRRRNRIASYNQHLTEYFNAISRAEAFSLYEKLFAQWHLLHLPLFIILVLAAIMHILAVHLY